MNARASRAEHRGYAYVHTALDDNSRLAYTRIHSDEQAHAATGFWRRAVIWFASHGITVERVLTDNGSCCRSRLRKRTCHDLDVTLKYTKPNRPQTNGKFERYHRRLLVERASSGPATATGSARRPCADGSTSTMRVLLCGGAYRLTCLHRSAWMLDQCSDEGVVGADTGVELHRSVRGLQDHVGFRVRGHQRLGQDAVAVSHLGREGDGVPCRGYGEGGLADGVQ